MNEHRNDFLCISKRLMSIISAVLLLILFFAFMTGYVWGKRVALEDILRTVEEKTFADQISGSLYSLAGSHGNDSDKKQELDVDSVVVQGVDDSKKSFTDTLIAESTVIASDENKKNDPIDDAIVENDARGYYAQLIGFNSKKAANQFVNRISNTQLVSFVKERFSKNIHGKKKVWYQVVTQRYENKEELERLVAHITKREHLSGVHIITV